LTCYFACEGGATLWGVIVVETTWSNLEGLTCE